ncbi:unnamed protein product [Candida verbasci]|uniref:Uncharacterized protein n=1 Tax=Candida verbasci TaxID=1227364 RepID=A0A9W4U1P1_9ASCO|nr:unnamed protein product [Candida verbasci]
MVDNELIYLLLLIVVVYVIGKIFQLVKDVPDLYLNEQSIIEPVRLENESSVYHSNKNFGLRSGLDIRYDSYKLRNGNLFDVWEIVLNNARKNGDRGLTINGKLVKFGELNSILQNIQLKEQTINLPLSSSVDLNWLVVLLYGFLNQIPVQFSKSQSTRFEIPNYKNTLDFENEYHPDKDKGIALRFSGDKVVEFTQLNIISAIASTIKHLPLTYNFKNKTMLLIPPKTGSNEEILNFIAKLLVGMIENCQITIGDKFSPDYDIISLHESQLPYREPSFWQAPLLQLLKLGKYPYNNERLMYINNSISSKPIFSPSQLNKLRISYKCRIIKEFGYFNMVGPVILTDYFDYREFSNLFGCIFQSIDIKLINGYLSIRGYTIGKTTIDNKLESKDNNGFMPVDIKGKWGRDGCLYIQQ